MQRLPLRQYQRSGCEKSAFGQASQACENHKTNLCPSGNKRSAQSDTLRVQSPMHDPQILRLAYVSCSQIEVRGVQAIMATAHRRNPQLEITGSLVFTGQYFFQTLEGPPASVDAMFSKICADDRHFGVKPVLREQTVIRRFDNWAMGFVLMPVMEQFVAPLFARGDADRADILSRMALQSLCRKT